MERLVRLVEEREAQANDYNRREGGQPSELPR